MNKTKIEWVRNPDGTQGYTWNPITGCLNGCPYCYARKLANGRLKPLYLANKNTAPIVPNVLLDNLGFLEMDPFYPRFWEDRLEPVGLTGGNKRPHSYGYLGGFREHKPKGIFVCDMSDLFGIGIPPEWTQRVMDTIKKCSDHRFYLLTKQPQNLVKFSPFPDNCWVGVTATNTTAMTQAMTSLARVEASVKFISFEPLLSQAYIMPEDFQVGGISWVIIGAQTKPYKPPKIEWVQEIVEACDKAGILVFLKDNLKQIVRVWKDTQEMPEGR